jgi:hypothetical protein
MTAVDRTKKAIGFTNDARHVTLCPKERDTHIAYSFGKGDNIEWDMQMVHEFGMELFLYDGGLVMPKIHPRFRFHKKDATDIGSIIDQNQHTSHDIILKCDIEGDEWDLFDAAKPEHLERFEQIIIEFHSLRGMGKRGIRVLENLNRTHQVVHVHGNNYGGYAKVSHFDIVLPSVLEVTYARRSSNEFIKCTESFPTLLDLRSNPHENDICIGRWGEI